MKSLAEELFDHVAACFSGIWIESHEHTDAIADIAALSRDNDWQLSTWDVCHGLANGNQEADQPEQTADPLSVLKTLGNSSGANQPSLLVLKNFHRFLGNAEIVQTLPVRSAPTATCCRPARSCSIPGIRPTRK